MARYESETENQMLANCYVTIRSEGLYRWCDLWIFQDENTANGEVDKVLHDFENYVLETGAFMR